jgi:hypothetical protein
MPVANKPRVRHSKKFGLRAAIRVKNNTHANRHQTACTVMKKDSFS